MAVSHSEIKADLLTLYNEMYSTRMSENDFADRMATIIRDAILSATVNSGIAVQVNTGTGTGATTSPGALS